MCCQNLRNKTARNLTARNLTYLNIPDNELTIEATRSKLGALGLCARMNAQLTRKQNKYTCTHNYTFNLMFILIKSAYLYIIFCYFATHTML